MILCGKRNCCLVFQRFVVNFLECTCLCYSGWLLLYPLDCIVCFFLVSPWQLILMSTILILVALRYAMISLLMSLFGWGLKVVWGFYLDEPQTSVRHKKKRHFEHTDSAITYRVKILFKNLFFSKQDQCFETNKRICQ